MKCKVYNSCLKFIKHIVFDEIKDWNRREKGFKGKIKVEGV